MAVTSGNNKSGSKSGDTQGTSDGVVAEICFTITDKSVRIRTCGSDLGLLGGMAVLTCMVCGQMNLSTIQLVNTLSDIQQKFKSVQSQEGEWVTNLIEFLIQEYVSTQDNPPASLIMKEMS